MTYGTQPALPLYSDSSRMDITLPNNDNELVIPEAKMIEDFISTSQGEYFNGSLFEILGDNQKQIVFKSLLQSLSLVSGNIGKVGVGLKNIFDEIISSDSEIGSANTLKSVPSYKDARDLLDYVEKGTFLNDLPDSFFSKLDGVEQGHNVDLIRERLYLTLMDLTGATVKYLEPNNPDEATHNFASHTSKLLDS